jgi:hypothetical protein
MAVPTDKLDDLVVGHLEKRLQPERLETILTTVLDRRQERSERQREHIAELNRRAAESEARLKRLHDAIEAGVADLDDPARKDRIDGLKSWLLQTLVANVGANAVPTQGLKWRMGRDSNPRSTRVPSGFQDRRLKPLGHPSGARSIAARAIAANIV